MSSKTTLFYEMEVKLFHDETKTRYRYLDLKTAQKWHKKIHVADIKWQKSVS